MVLLENGRRNGFMFLLLLLTKTTPKTRMIMVTTNLVYFSDVGLRLPTLLQLMMSLMSHPEGGFVILLYVSFNFTFKVEKNNWGFSLVL
jgi:hypothetical protein